MAVDKDVLAIEGGQPVAEEPFPPLWLGPSEIDENEVEAVAAVVRSQTLFRYLDDANSRCTELENKFRAMTGCRHALALGGGTAALIAGLTGIGVGDGDEVILPGYTYIASAAAVIICGGVPVIAEIDDSLTLDPEDVERKITSRTKAIMPVHMRGFPCDMDSLLDVAKRHDLLVIEDVAQADGGSYKGRRLGSMGNVGCFSLQQYKLITAGEGGIVVTNDDAVYHRAALRHDSAMHFWKPGEANVPPFAGENFRMNEMEGALGCVQFDRLEGILARCRSAKRRIAESFTGLPNITPHVARDTEGECGIAAGFFCATNELARKVAEALRAEGIPAGSMNDPGMPDRHIYKYWEYVIGKTSSDPLGRPWTSPAHDGSRVYTPDMCPRTLDLLGRSVFITICQKYEDRHVDWTIRAVRKVVEKMC